MLTRLLDRVLIFSGLTYCLFSGAAFAQGIRAMLPDTGSPPPAMNRFERNILVEAGEKKFLFDAGRGAVRHLAQLKVKWQGTDAVSVIHLHSGQLVPATHNTYAGPLEVVEDLMVIDAGKDVVVRRPASCKS
jgi:ribonuclease Z